MTSVNKCMILGRLGKDPEMRYTPSGVPVCNFTLATSESFKDKDGNRNEKTEWHKIVCFNKTAELCGNHLSKGRLVFIEGKIQHRQYDDRDGVKRSITEIVAHQMQFVDSKSNGAPTEGAGANTPKPAAFTGHQDSGDMGYNEPGAEDDIPF